MPPNSTPTSTNTSTPPQPHIQPSIRSFFQPRLPKYTPPPSLPTTKLDTHEAISSGNSTSPINQLPHVQKGPKIPQIQTPQIQPLEKNTSLLQSQPPKSTPLTSQSNGASITNAPFKLQTAIPLPPQAEILIPLESHILPLRRINSLLLPIPYPDTFYSRITSSSPSFSRIITWSDPSFESPKVIGGIICRLDSIPSSSPPTYEIYIQSLALLSPYRDKGLATSLLNTIISSASSISQSQSEEIRIEGLYAHVWTSNTEALEWYIKRGFTKDPQIINGYYRRLKPDTAWVLRRKLNPSDLLDALPLPSPALNMSKKEGGLGIERPGMGGVGTKSFQDRRPEREWNDLPEDVLVPPPGGLLKPGKGSADSSRSSSTSRSATDRGKKKRAYPAAAFGGPGT